MKECPLCGMLNDDAATVCSSCKGTFEQPSPAKSIDLATELWGDPERDQTILDTTTNLSSSLGIKGIHVERVVWEEQGPRTPDSPDIGLRGTLLMGKALRDKLSPEEWRPLLASSIVYTSRFRMRRRLRAVSDLITSGVIFTILVWYVFQVLLLVPPSFQSGLVRPLAYGIIALFCGIVILFWRLLAPSIIHEKLASDRIVSEKFGMRSDLLTVLNKIQSLVVIPDSKEKWGNPTIFQRIQNLSTTP